MKSPGFAFALMVTATGPASSRTFQYDVRIASYVQAQRRKCKLGLLSSQHPSSVGSWKRYRSATINRMTKNDDDDDDEGGKKLPSFMDAMLEIPDPRLLAGDLLFILIINFLLQIANEVSDSDFWMNGGFGQPMTMPTSLLAVIVRDSKMSIAWVLGGLWNRSYSSSSVSDDETAILVALKVWVDYCSLRILLELGDSILFTHSTISMWIIAREVWYTAIVMSFFRWAYSRFR
ncbi:hypothetical protein ACHAW5_005163 [Stephanodiscus triporus]|uniref:Uncharacterized protein n=1 Tax=Stephanodiscus triporus TaxID=2934178 RepID=A0ABD3R4E3_9STRA